GEAQAEPTQHRIQERATQSRRRAEEQRVLARGEADGVLRTLDLRDETPRAEQREVAQVPLTMVLHGVSSAHHLTCELRAALHALTDAKKGCLGAALIEEVEHPRGDSWVGTVIDRDCELPPAGGALGQPRPVGSEERAPRGESGCRKNNV